MHTLMWDLSSQTRDQTYFSCTGRQILKHWTTREVPRYFLLREWRECFLWHLKFKSLHWINPSLATLLFGCSVGSNSLWPHGLRQDRLPCPSLSPRVCSNSSSWSRWSHPTILSSVAPFSSCAQSFLASGPFPMSQFFASGGQSIGASASVLPMNIQGWFPLGWTGLIPLLSKGLSRVFSNTAVQKHQFLATCLPLVTGLYLSLPSKPNCLKRVVFMYFLSIS